MADNTDGRAAVLRTRDFTGRDVIDASGSKVGTVRDLLLDRRNGSIRFIDLDLGTFRKRVVVPVREIEWGEDAFVLRRWTADQVNSLPAYESERPLTGGMLDEMALAYPRFYGEEEHAAPLAAPGEPQILPMKDAKDFKLASGEADLKGWTVFGSDGERIGTVTDLLVDPAALKVRYLSVELLEDLFSLKETRRVLLPTEAIELRERGKDIWVQGLPAREVARLPAYTGGAVDPLIAARVAKAFDSVESTRAAPPAR